MQERPKQRNPTPSPRIPYPALRRCPSLDLEVSEHDGSLLAAAAHRPDSGNSLSMSERPKNSSLERFDRLAENALFLLGDNISQHGIPQLRAYNPTSGS